MPQRAPLLGHETPPRPVRPNGHIKVRHLESVRPKWDELMVEWRAGPRAMKPPPAASGFAAGGPDTLPTTQPLDSRLEA